MAEDDFEADISSVMASWLFVDLNDYFATP